jgi:hypothetical protein
LFGKLGTDMRSLLDRGCHEMALSTPVLSAIALSRPVRHTSYLHYKPLRQVSKPLYFLPLRYAVTGAGFWTQRRVVSGHLRPYGENGRILLANLFQGSSSTFSCASIPSFFAFKEGMWDTKISALLNSPTVSGGFLRQKCIPVLASEKGGSA